MSVIAPQAYWAVELKGNRTKITLPHWFSIRFDLQFRAVHRGGEHVRFINVDGVGKSGKKGLDVV